MTVTFDPRRKSIAARRDRLRLTHQPGNGARTSDGPRCRSLARSMMMVAKRNRAASMTRVSFGRRYSSRLAARCGGFFHSLRRPLPPDLEITMRGLKRRLRMHNDTASRADKGVSAKRRRGVYSIPTTNPNHRLVANPEVVRTVSGDQGRRQSRSSQTHATLTGSAQASKAGARFCAEGLLSRRSRGSAWECLPAAVAAWLLGSPVRRPWRAAWLARPPPSGP